MTIYWLPIAAFLASAILMIKFKADSVFAAVWCAVFFSGLFAAVSLYAEGMRRADVAHLAYLVVAAWMGSFVALIITRMKRRVRRRQDQP